MKPSRVLQTSHTAQSQKNKQPIKNLGSRPKQTFLQRRHTDGQQTHEKILNITIREMQIKTAMRYHFTSVRIGWRGRWEGGSGWGIHVNPRLIHVNV